MWPPAGGCRLKGLTSLSLGGKPKSPTHKPEPYSDGSEFDDSEIVCVVLFVARRDGAEMLEFVEEAFDEISEAIEIGAEGGDVHPIGRGLCPCALACEAGPQGVAVVAAVGQKDLALAETVEHVVGASSVMGLSGRQLQENGRRRGHGFSWSIRLASAPCSGLQRGPEWRAEFFQIPLFAVRTVLVDP